jgi:hypothetical protein
MSLRILFNSCIYTAFLRILPSEDSRFAITAGNEPSHQRGLPEEEFIRVIQGKRGKNLSGRRALRLRWNLTVFSSLRSDDFHDPPASGLMTFFTFSSLLFPAGSEKFFKTSKMRRIHRGSLKQLSSNPVETIPFSFPSGSSELRARTVASAGRPWEKALCRSDFRRNERGGTRGCIKGYQNAILIIITGAVI